MSIALSVALLGMLLVVPSTLFLYKTFINLQLEHIQSIISYTHHKAMIEQQTLEIVIDLKNNALKTPYGIMHMHPTIIFDMMPALLGPPSKPHKPITKACSFVNNTLFCYPDGTASAGTLYLVDTSYQWQHALSIVPDKGCFMRKYFYDAHRWYSY